MSNWLEGLPTEILEKGFTLSIRKVTERVKNQLLSSSKHVERQEYSAYGFDISAGIGDFFGYEEGGSILFVPILYVDPPEYAVCGRYERHHDVCNFDDIVMLNYQLWLRYRERSDGWAAPATAWIPEMERLDLISKRETVVYSPKGAR